MTTSSRTTNGSLVPIVLIKLLRPLVRWLRRLKKAVRSTAVVRDISDEVFFSEFTPAEQRGHEGLVADATRMNAYRAAIRRNINAGDVVVDVGTGTGILAMLAAQQGPRVVHAIDTANIITLAERIARANHFTNIVFQQTSSRRFVLDEPVDIILHEIIGQSLVDEGLIESALDLKKRLLKKSGRILPGKFEIFLEPACVKDGRRIPYLWQTKFPGIDFSSVTQSPGNQASQPTGQDWQVDARSAIDYFLCDAAPILAFDLNEINEPTEVPNTVSASRVVRRAGRMDGFCFYFRVVFDDEVAFDTSPFSPWTHWENLYVRVESREYREGDTITYRLEMKDRLDFETWVVQITEPPRPRRSGG